MSTATTVAEDAPSSAISLEGEDSGYWSPEEFGSLVEPWLAEAKSRGRDLSLLLMEATVRGDKADPAPEPVVCAVAELVEQTLRGSDSVYRVGPSRICVLMPNTSARNALIAADRIHQRLQATEEGTALEGVQLIMGVGGHEEDVQSAVELYQRAEVALDMARAADSSGAFLYF